ncbi:hypothetical protein FHS15_000349 [Paenibacillus castaneae]|uniref:hypothetical protein n=1 Tax=Paenibacillus castaneae TaxID=474957 RepID=UPI00141BC0C5|nr:hypothetical protein [Paenibacillus castaneae]NIK75251.1 hypothetical protein [Paenibacillus castaneae]
MPKNSADPKLDREDNRADKKNNVQDNDNLTEPVHPLTNDKAADYVPSLNGISKKES